MRIIKEGYEYILEDCDVGNIIPSAAPDQTLMFIEKGATGGGGLIRLNPGTTNEEVLAVLANRLNFLYTKLPDPHTAEALLCVQKAISELEARTAERKERGVEGTHNA